MSSSLWCHDVTRSKHKENTEILLINLKHECLVSTKEFAGGGTALSCDSCHTQNFDHT